jgi:hypothetical protein
MEEIVRQLGLRSLPGWILIVLGIVDVLEKANFVLEHLSFLTEPWGRSALIFLGLAYFFILHYVDKRREKKRLATAASSTDTSSCKTEKQIFFFSPGIAVSLNRSTPSVVVNLHVLSTDDTELIYIHVELTDSSGLRISCQHSEPIAVQRFDLTAKSIEQKISAQEADKFQKGLMVNLNGYAKFRDNGAIRTQRISLTTIPNV